jgi:hypothetical protein
MRSGQFTELCQVLLFPIAAIDRQYQQCEQHPSNGVSHFFAFSPISTSRRMSVGIPSDQFRMGQMLPSQQSAAHIFNLFTQCNISLSESFHLLPIFVSTAAFQYALTKLGHLFADRLLSTHETIDGKLSRIKLRIIPFLRGHLILPFPFSPSSTPVDGWLRH